MGRAIKKPIFAGDVAKHLGLVCTAPSFQVREVGSLMHHGDGVLSFAKNAAWASKASVDLMKFISPEHYSDELGSAILSNNPRLDFARSLAYLQQVSGFVWSQDPAKVDPTARLGANVVLGKGVVIGSNSIIGHNVVIGDEVEIGSNVTIKSGAIVGEDGFGFERDISGVAVRLLHIGKVIIEDDVEIGSLTTICRGTLDNTVIKRSAKIDDHVHIAHNVVVGSGAFVIACAEISGGVKLGENVWIAPNAAIMNQVKIGDRATVGLGAVVLKSVDDEDVVVGNPAKSLKRKES
jgi:UDP-3-O-[3-hydroxymyristoyl] glucosamine N-acyltransferase